MEWRSLLVCCSFFIWHTISTTETETENTDKNDPRRFCFPKKFRYRGQSSMMLFTNRGKTFIRGKHLRANIYSERERERERDY